MILNYIYNTNYKTLYMGYGSNYQSEIKKYITENPDCIKFSWSEISRRIGLKDYRPVKRFFDSNEDFIKSLKRQKSLDNWEDTNYGKNDRPDEINFENKPEGGLDLPNFKEYCKLHGVPYEKATSAKFINHNGQAAWNIFCDLTKISESHLNNYFDKLKKRLSKKIKPLKINKSNDLNDEKAYVFWFSDKHVGAHTKEKSMFGNEYNIDVFRKRMIKSLEDFKIALNQFGKFDKVIIGDLGDALDGWDEMTTRKNSTHILPQNANNRESFDAYVKVMCEFMETLINMDAANNYQYISVTNDNHSSDFGYICNRAVEVWLNVKYPEIDTVITEKFIEHFYYGVHTFMVSHGKDSEHRKHGFPLNLDKKTEYYINTYIDEYDLKGNLHFIKGDLHMASENYGRKFRYRNVWSLYGSSDWAQTNFGPNPSGVSTEIVYKNINKVLKDEIIF